MSEWIPPVVDRTAADVAARSEKGVFCAVDMQRIWQDAEWLGGLFGVEVAAEDWRDGDFLFLRDQERIWQAMEGLRGGFKGYMEGFLPPSMKAAPRPPWNHWEQFNLVEGVEHHAHRIVRQNAEEWKYAGEGCAGVEIGVL